MNFVPVATTPATKSATVGSLRCSQATAVNSTIPSNKYASRAGIHSGGGMENRGRGWHQRERCEQRNHTDAGATREVDEDETDAEEHAPHQSSGSTKLWKRPTPTRARP